MATATKPNALRERFQRALAKLTKREGMERPMTYRQAADRMGLKYTAAIHSILRGDIDRGGGPNSKQRAKLIEWLEGVEK